ncbi:hypothetical protein Cch01nite_14480 [Cellulomonas chitinilytica]|uniref:3-methyl-2-oxobutanoate hydroxymethyltransferase n=1 Tax=Cellulomonas chitinilytica TaxID=398759 RepID=A0A919U229_9CELL|nr:isocitrate lyase/phosphoenolpyruvate mutase family protein [Cellulomonas chitinilytica]GIG20724.1 hypothetical protein Cch01nite_14480 [Cellulomonas chitinilytica]
MTATATDLSRTRTMARRLRDLADAQVLLLANVWDAASAVVAADAGAPALATTSGGVAWAIGRGDGQRATRDEMLAAAARIVAAVDVPVSVDVEGGYGPSPDDVARTVARAVEVGAAGINLEDSRAAGGPLFDVADQVGRLLAARAAATSAGAAEIVVNVRTDVVLFGVGTPETRLDEVLRRAAAYASAGADSLFVPGLLDLDVLAELCARSPLPVNAMAGPGAPDVVALVTAGVRRVSLGTSVAQAAYAVVERATRELLRDGTYEHVSGGLDYGRLDGLVDRH